MDFYFETYELSEAEIELLARYAQVAPDMCISVQGESHTLNRLKFNMCVILLSWRLSDCYGMQRVTVGSEVERTRAWWAKQLRAGEHDDKIAKRIEALGKFFDDDVECEVMGFMLRRTTYRDHSAHLRFAPSELKVLVTPDGQNDIPAKLEKKTHGKR